MQIYVCMLTYFIALLISNKFEDVDLKEDNSLVKNSSGTQIL